MNWVKIPLHVIICHFCPHSCTLLSLFKRLLINEFLTFAFMGKLTAHKLRMVIAENSSIDDESVFAVNYELIQAFKTWLKILNLKGSPSVLKTKHLCSMDDLHISTWLNSWDLPSGTKQALKTTVIKTIGVLMLFSVSQQVSKLRR